MGRMKNCTQSEANYWFEGPPMDIAESYVAKTVTVMISVFFMPLYPLSLAFGVASLSLNYLVDKYLLITRYTSPKATGANLCFEMYHFFDFVLITMAVNYKVILL